jgi:hypothetical protein
VATCAVPLCRKTSQEIPLRLRIRQPACGNIGTGITFLHTRNFGRKSVHKSAGNSARNSTIHAPAQLLSYCLRGKPPDEVLRITNSGDIAPGDRLRALNLTGMEHVKNMWEKRGKLTMRAVEL